MVDILGILGTLKGKVLDASHYDLLEHAYRLQQENVTQLKENNAALRESNGLLREDLLKSKDQLAALERELAALREKIQAVARDEKPIDLSEKARAILLWMVKHDLSSFYDSQLHQARLGSKLEIETAIDELEAAKLIDVSGYGSTGTHYFLTDAGKRFVLTMTPQLAG